MIVFYKLSWETTGSKCDGYFFEVRTGTEKWRRESWYLGDINTPVAAVREDGKSEPIYGSISLAWQGNECEVFSEDFALFFPRAWEHDWDTGAPGEKAVVGSTRCVVLALSAVPNLSTVSRSPL